MSRSKSSGGRSSAVTIDRNKALKFVSKQEFLRMEDQSGKTLVQTKERDWYQHSADNKTYAENICHYTVQRHIELLEKLISKMNIKNPNRMQYISKRDHLQQRFNDIVQTRLNSFYQFVGLLPNIMAPSAAFVIANPMMSRYQYPSNPYGQIQQLQQLNMNTSIQPPPTKRAKLSHPNITNNTNNMMITKKVEKTKEEKENEAIKNHKIPHRLLNKIIFEQWLDDQLKTMNEYEILIFKRDFNGKQMEKQKKWISNLRRDIDIQKSTILQQNTSKIQETFELKKIYYKMNQIDKMLPVLRQFHIKPYIQKYMEQFAKCHVKQTIDAQKGIKKILKTNKFNEKAQRFCNVRGKELIKNQLFKSQINETLNDDLELLRDFGVKFYVEQRKENKVNFNLWITFIGHFGFEIDKKWKPPNLVVMIDENKYKHFYGMLPCFNKLKKRFIDFVFVLKRNKINNNNNNDDDDDDDDDDDIDINKNDKGMFEEKHLKWLDQYKMNTLKTNGEFVSIVNVYNFYHDAIKALIKEIHNKSKQKK